MMKLVACCLLVVVYGTIRITANEIPHELRDKIVRLRQKCHKETGVDIEHVDRTVEGYFQPSGILGCYFSCLFNAFHLLDHDGHIDFDKMILKIPEYFQDHGEEMIAKCRHLTGNNPCDSAFNVVQCFQKTNPEKFVII